MWLTAWGVALPSERMGEGEGVGVGVDAEALIGCAPSDSLQPQVSDGCFVCWASTAMLCVCGCFGGCGQLGGGCLCDHCERVGA